MILALFFCGLSEPSFSQDKAEDAFVKKIDTEVQKMMKEGDIPGLSLIVIRGNQRMVRSYGFMNLEHKKRVTPNTLFELGSCSKAFTALGVLNLEKQKQIKLDNYVSDYIPWLKFQYKGRPVQITIRQLLHHTSGIPWNTISKIPVSDKDDALDQTVRKLIGQELSSRPGRQYEYATINYDVLALIIQRVTGTSFEEYIEKHVFQQLNLHHTSFSKPVNPAQMATGYKIGFFDAREFDAPVYKGNNAAGYVISNANDMETWLRFQMGQTGSDLYGLAAATHQRDETVPLHDMSAYAMGWEVSLKGDNEIYHGGVNPNYSSYVAFRPKQHLGVAVLTNSNSSFTPVIANEIVKMLAREPRTEKFHTEDRNDKAYSIVSIIIGVYILLVVLFFVLIIIDVVFKRRRYGGMSFSTISGFLVSLVFVLPFLLGFYLFPSALAGFTWESTIVWSPVSFIILTKLILASIGITYLVNFLSLIFPHKEEFKQIAPKILLMSMLSGIANMILILLITSSVGSNVELKYLVFYYSLALTLYIFGRKFVQINLIKLTRKAVYEIRLGLFEKIFSTSYQKFEKINRGRIYTVLNEDVGTVGESTNMFVMLITSVFTALCAFLYLATIAFWATTLTVLLIGTLATIYYLVSKSTNKYYEEARDTRNVFMRLTNGMIDGFKEISLHRNKKLEYHADVAAAANEYRDKISIAGIRFLYAFLVGESLLIILLGAVSFALPKLFPSILDATIMSFVIVLLYLIGPINRILGAVPAIMQLKIAWNRIQQFLKEIPSNLDLKAAPFPLEAKVEQIKANGIKFRYEENGLETFTVGPIDLEANAGEILFIIGGNGSGKTTLAKLITGLYEPDEGEILINHKVVAGAQLSEYFSTVFSPAHLFDKLYNIDIEAKQEVINQYLQLLDLDKKVNIKGNLYSTINLSGGQRKRLALLQCYLEDSPIYLFDEWAADQDPGYRNFFYRKLLPEMKKLGKIIIAITHDDHYFDVADKVLKMKQGKLEIYSNEYAADIPISAIEK